MEDSNIWQASFHKTSLCASILFSLLASTSVAKGQSPTTSTRGLPIAIDRANHWANDARLVQIQSEGVQENGASATGWEYLFQAKSRENQEFSVKLSSEGAVTTQEQISGRRWNQTRSFDAKGLYNSSDIAAGASAYARTHTTINCLWTLVLTKFPLKSGPAYKSLPHNRPIWSATAKCANGRAAVLYFDGISGALLKGNLSDQAND
jgi:hypothetical protein